MHDINIYHAFNYLYLHATVTVGLFCMFVSVSNRLDKPMSKRCTARQTFPGHSETTNLCLHQSGSQGSQKSILSEQYEKYGNIHNWNSHFQSITALTELNSVCSSTLSIHNTAIACASFLHASFYSTGGYRIEQI